MSNRPNRLDRKSPYHAMTSLTGVGFHLWSPDGHGVLHAGLGDINVSLDDKNGESVLTIYGVRNELLASLYAQIGDYLGVAPNVTVQHLEQLHSNLGEMLGERRKEMAQEAHQEFHEFESTHTKSPPQGEEF